MNDNILKIKHTQNSGQCLIIKIQLKYSTDLCAQFLCIKTLDSILNAIAFENL